MCSDDLPDDLCCDKGCDDLRFQLWKFSTIWGGRGGQRSFWTSLPYPQHGCREPWIGMHMSTQLIDDCAGSCWDVPIVLVMTSGGAFKLCTVQAKSIVNAAASIDTTEHVLINLRALTRIALVFQK
eukprot:1871-Amphidinium_carterae.1